MGNDPIGRGSRTPGRPKPESNSVPRSYRAAIGQLKSAQKPIVGAPAYSRFINRPLGKRFAALAYVLGLTPNAVTGISALFTFTGVALVALASPNLWLGPLVAGLLILGYALDSADGQLARLRGGGSAQGEWLDHVVDAAKESGLHLAVLISFYRYFEFDGYRLLIPIAFVFVCTVVFFAMILRDLLTERHLARTGAPRAPVAPPSALRTFLVLPSDYGFLALSFVLIGASTVFFVTYTVLLVCNAAYALAALVKWYHDVGALADR